MGTASERPLFVVGHPRSGTTLLRLILNEHSRIVIPPEAHLVSYLRRVEHKFGPLTDEANRRRAAERLVNKERMREWGLDRDTLFERAMTASSPGAMLDAVMRLWTEKQGKPRWGEKTPGTYRYLPSVNKWFPDCQVIHIVRDGRDVAISCLTPPFSDLYDKGNVYEVALRWRDAIHRCRRAARFLGPQRFLQLRYEDLTAQPEQKIQQICDFLGEAFEPAMLNYHQKAQDNVVRGDQSFHERTRQQVNRSRVERWRKDADEAFVCGFEGVAGKEMQELGYTLSGYQPDSSQRMRILYEKYRPRRLIHNYRVPKRARRSSAASG